MKIYDTAEGLEDRFSSNSSVSCDDEESPSRLFYKPDSLESSEVKVERRIEILELHDLLLDELWKDEISKENSQKIFQVELLEDPSQVEKKEQEDKEWGAIENKNKKEDLGSPEKTKGNSQAGAFSTSPYSDRLG